MRTVYVVELSKKHHVKKAVKSGLERRGFLRLVKFLAEYDRVPFTSPKTLYFPA